MKIYEKMSWVDLANYIINNLKEGDTIEFATDYTEWEGYHCWYFIRIVRIPEYQSRFIVIDYCGGGEAYVIPLNNYSHGFDEDDKDYIREYIKDYFKLCNNLGFEDAPVWVEEEIKMAKNYNWALTDSDCYQHIRCVNGVYELVQFVWLDTTKQEKNDGVYEYCIANATCNLNDYSEKDIEIYISSYGYTHEGLIKEYGEDGANDLIAECILEEICLRDECIMYECNTKEECVEYINNFMNLEEK